MWTAMTIDDGAFDACDCNGRSMNVASDCDCNSTLWEIVEEVACGVCNGPGDPTTNADAMTSPTGTDNDGVCD